MKTSLALVAMISSFSIAAADIDSATTIQNKTNQSSALSQKKINTSVQKAYQLNADINQLKEELHNLAIYKQHLNGLIENQNGEIQSFNSQLTEIKQTRQGIVPLMYDMLDGLESLIEHDKPIKKEQRLARVKELRSLMTRADVSEAEKYRRILEAYQIELQYGNKMATYRGEIHIANNQKTVVADMFYLGRAVLIARSLDESKYWTWDQNKQQWIDGDTDYMEDINQAYQLANQKISPTLLSLPLSLNTAEVK